MPVRWAMWWATWSAMVRPWLVSAGSRSASRATAGPAWSRSAFHLRAAVSVVKVSARFLLSCRNRTRYEVVPVPGLGRRSRELTRATPRARGTGTPPRRAPAALSIGSGTGALGGRAGRCRPPTPVRQSSSPNPGVGAPAGSRFLPRRFRSQGAFVGAPAALAVEVHVPTRAEGAVQLLINGGLAV